MWPQRANVRSQPTAAIKTKERGGRYYQVSCGGRGLPFLWSLRLPSGSENISACMTLLSAVQELRAHPNVEAWELPGEVASSSTTLRPRRFTLEVHINHHPPPQNKATTRRAWVPKVSPDVGGSGCQQQREGKYLFDGGSWNIPRQQTQSINQAVRS